MYGSAIPHLAHCMCMYIYVIIDISSKIEVAIPTSFKVEVAIPLSLGYAGAHILKRLIPTSFREEVSAIFHLPHFMCICIYIHMYTYTYIYIYSKCVQMILDDSI